MKENNNKMESNDSALGEAIKLLERACCLNNDDIRFDIDVSDFITQHKASNGWISVEDKPLVTHEGKNWRVNDDVPDEFLAALEAYNSETGKDYWWIRHCVIEDKRGLCIVGDDLENIPAGWEVRDIEFYMPIPKPPVK